VCVCGGWVDVCVYVCVCVCVCFPFSLLTFSSLSLSGRYRETGTVGPAFQAPGPVTSSEGLVGSGDLALLTI